MRKKLILSLLLVAGLTVVSSMVFASEPENKGQNSVSSDRSVAVSALNTMSEYLRSLDKFTIRGSVVADEVLANDQKVQLSRSVTIKADPPSNLWIKTSSVYSHQEFFFDGKTFTIVTPGLGFYASFDAPKTIAKTIIKARNKFNIELPLSDLFLWGSKLDTETETDEAFLVGKDQINGISCNQFAFLG